LGLGKTASAHFIQVADEVWREKGIRCVSSATVWCLAEIMLTRQ
jgi:hypothetical protein